MKNEKEMTQDEIVAAITKLEPNDIMKVYSGKPGCACGCLGNYRVHPLHLALASMSRGYAYDAEDLNLSQVKKVLNILKTHAREAKHFSTGFFVDVTSDSGSVRTYSIYIVAAYVKE